MALYCDELGHLLYVNPIHKKVYQEADLLRIFEKGRQKFIEDTVDKVYRAVLLGIFDGKKEITVEIEGREEMTLLEIVEKVRHYFPSLIVEWSGAAIIAGYRDDPQIEHPSQ